MTMQTAEALYTQNRKLLYQVARRYAPLCERDRAVTIDDLAQEGWFGLYKAAQTYNAEAGKSWVSWAYWHINNAVKSALGLRKRAEYCNMLRFCVASLDAPINSDAEDSLLDTLPGSEISQDEHIEQMTSIADVRAAVARLPAIERRITVAYYLRECPTGQIAEALGIHKDEVQKIRTRARSRLSRDPHLQKYDKVMRDNTRYYAHKGVRAFFSSGCSVVEDAVLWREEQRNKCAQRA